MKHFDQIHLDDLDAEQMSADLTAVAEAAEAASPDAAPEVMQQFDAIRARFRTWRSWAGLKFSQDTQQEAAKARRMRAERLGAEITGVENRIKGALMSPARRAALEGRAGAQPFALWQADAESYGPGVEPMLIEEQEKVTEYRSLTGGAKTRFQGASVSLTSLGPHLTSPDRAVREAATRARWSWFEENGEALDRIYGDLVAIRHRLARHLGFDSFTELGYRRMHRVDYNAADVARFRDEVVRLVTPLSARIRQAQAERLGLDKLEVWDLAFERPEGNPVPPTEDAAFLEAGREVFHGVHPEVGAFYDMMLDRGLVDLRARDGKAPGGFCTFLPEYGVPFVFANCNGTSGDVRVLTHEMGHAFQAYKSRNIRPLDVLMATYESCEIHSMSMEFLTWPQMEAMFGDDAEEFRRLHLKGALTFLPYGCAVDHFQHEVYAAPDATPAERRTMWREIDARYRPDLDASAIPHLASGGMWHGQMHVYVMPFYYIDYVLAQTCALQYWRRSLVDREEALGSYLALCERGGTLPFQALCRSADLTSPFEVGCLEDVVAAADAWLAS